MDSTNICRVNDTIGVMVQDVPEQKPAMSRWGLPLALLLALSSVGCGGYWPIRRPRSDLWSPTTITRPPIELPNRTLEDYPGRLEKNGVSVAVELIDPSRTQGLFHADLVRDGVQPLMVVIHNGSDQAYVFSKANVDRHYLPAEQVARLAYVHPIETIAHHIRWLAFLVPGVVFETVIEPASTLDFPGMEEAARRPAIPDNRSTKADFLNHQIADAEVLPGHSLAGVLFIRPPKLGSLIPVTLVNAQTRQPLVFEIPTPPPLYTVVRKYTHPSQRVWDAAVKAAARLPSWRVVSNSPTSGVITVRKGMPFLMWSNAARITIAVQKINPGRTQVTLASTIPWADSRGYGEHSPTIDKFFEALDRQLPRRNVRAPRPHRRLGGHVPSAASGPSGRIEIRERSGAATY